MENYHDHVYDFLNTLCRFSDSEYEEILKAYQFSKKFHQNQFRKGGEPYFSHPFSVAYKLSEMGEDVPLICAGFLHDTLEDTAMTKELMMENFGEDVTYLVDSVTKEDSISFSSKKEQNLYNRQKLLTRMLEDSRVIKLKLVDRYHNLTTISALPPNKQVENAIEAMVAFVPMANLLSEPYQKLGQEIYEEAEKYIPYSSIPDDLLFEYQRDYDLERVIDSYHLEMDHPKIYEKRH